MPQHSSQEREEHFVEAVTGFVAPQTKEEIAKARRSLPQGHIWQRIEECSVELVISVFRRKVSPSFP